MRENPTSDCAACQHLWDEYTSAAHDVLSVDDELHRAILTDDHDAMNTLTRALQHSTERARAARKAFVHHVRDVHKHDA